MFGKNNDDEFRGTIIFDVLQNGARPEIRAVLREGIVVVGGKKGMERLREVMGKEFSYRYNTNDRYKEQHPYCLST